MHCYHLFSGIDLAYSTFQASSCFMRNHVMSNVLEIASCQGPLWMEYKHGYVTYLVETSQKHPFSWTDTCISIGYDDGIAIIVDMDITAPILKNIGGRVCPRSEMNCLPNFVCYNFVVPCGKDPAQPPSMYFKRFVTQKDTAPMGTCGWKS